MGSKKSKQSLARRNVSSGSVYGSAGPESDNAKRGATTGQTIAAQAIVAASTATTEDAARIEVQAEARRVDSEAEVTSDLKPRRTTFVPRQCSSCTAAREMSPEAKGKNYVRVYCTRGNVRYCKCHYCNITWTQCG